MKTLKFIYFILLFAFSMTCYSQESNADYHFIKKINLEGPTGWDYLTMDNDRLFVSNDDRVHVVDVKTDSEIGVIQNLHGVHGITLAPEFNKGYISNGTDSTVTVFDYTTLKTLKTIQITGKKANSILYDKVSKRVFVFCSKSDYVVVIDAKTDAILTKIIVGPASEFPATNQKGIIFDNSEDANEITLIDTKKMQVINHFSLGTNKGPTSLEIDLKNNRLFSACRISKTLVVVDALNGKIISTLPIGGGCDGVTYIAEEGLIITANGEGTATIIKQESANKYSVIQTLKTEPRLRTITNNKNNHRIYISGAVFEGKKGIPNSFGVYVYGEN